MSKHEYPMSIETLFTVYVAETVATKEEIIKRVLTWIAETPIAGCVLLDVLGRSQFVLRFDVTTPEEYRAALDNSIAVQTILPHGVSPERRELIVR